MRANDLLAVLDGGVPRNCHLVTSTLTLGAAHDSGIYPLLAFNARRCYLGLVWTRSPYGVVTFSAGGFLLGDYDAIRLGLYAGTPEQVAFIASFRGNILTPDTRTGGVLEITPTPTDPIAFASLYGGLGDAWTVTILEGFPQ